MVVSALTICLLVFSSTVAYAYAITESTTKTYANGSKDIKYTISGNALNQSASWKRTRIINGSPYVDTGINNVSYGESNIYLTFYIKSSEETTIEIKIVDNSNVNNVSYEQDFTYPAAEIPTPTASPTSTPSPTPTPSTNPSPTPSNSLSPPTGITVLKPSSELGSTSLSWQPVPGAEMYGVYVNGQYAGYSLTPDKDLGILGTGDFTVQVVSVSNGIESAKSEPISFSIGGEPENPNTACNGCQMIKDALACPEWGQFMGEWGNVIRNNVPPAPNWNQVAETFRDTIVPAIGQQLVDKAPIIAKAIGDDFQSREKPVPTPKPLPNFQPNVPVLTDLPSKIESSLTDNVPNFEPDYSRSVPFTIPDPLQINMDPKDKGYMDLPAPTPGPSYAAKGVPDYKGGKDYKPMPEVNMSAPAYQPKAANQQQPAPSYKTGTTDAQPPPAYKSVPTATAPTYQMGDTGDVPVYQVRQ